MPFGPTSGAKTTRGRVERRFLQGCRHHLPESLETLDLSFGGTLFRLCLSDE